VTLYLAAQNEVGTGDYGPGLTAFTTFDPGQQSVLKAQCGTLSYSLTNVVDFDSFYEDVSCDIINNNNVIETVSDQTIIIGYSNFSVGNLLIINNGSLLHVGAGSTLIIYSNLTGNGTIDITGCFGFNQTIIIHLPSLPSQQTPVQVINYSSLCTSTSNSESLISITIDSGNNTTNSNKCSQQAVPQLGDTSLSVLLEPSSSCADGVGGAGSGGDGSSGVVKIVIIVVVIVAGVLCILVSVSGASLLFILRYLRKRKTLSRINQMQGLI